MASTGGGVTLALVVVVVVSFLVSVSAAPGLQSKADDVQSAGGQVGAAARKNDTLPITTGFTTTASTTGVPSCDGGFTLVGGRCVLVEPFTQTSWHESRFLCQTLDGDLVVLDSMDFYADLLTHLKDKGLDTHSYWVGGSGSDLSWLWVDGSRVRMGTPLWAQSRYDSQEPDGSVVDDNCTFLDDTRYFFMNEDECEESKRCICQRTSSESAVPQSAVFLPLDSNPAFEASVVESPGDTNPVDIKTAAVATPALTCRDSFEPVGGKCVLVEPFTSTSWHESRFLCQTFGGDLVVLDSMDFYAALLDYIKDVGLNTHDYWVGASDADSEGTWRWVDGSSVRNGTPLWSLDYEGSSYYQEPDGGPFEDCGLVSYSSFYYLSDSQCSYSYPCICESPAL